MFKIYSTRRILYRVSILVGFVTSDWLLLRVIISHIDHRLWLLKTFLRWFSILWILTLLLRTEILQYRLIIVKDFGWFHRIMNVIIGGDIFAGVACVTLRDHNWINIWLGIVNTLVWTVFPGVFFRIKRCFESLVGIARSQLFHGSLYFASVNDFLTQVVINNAFTLFVLSCVAIRVWTKTLLTFFNGLKLIQTIFVGNFLEFCYFIRFMFFVKSLFNDAFTPT